jgi:hypothetical protein
MPELFDISNWTKQPYYSTKGSRNKSIVADARGIQYHFKTSLYKPANGNKPERDYKFEFWSEIIAYELGYLLGFKVLKYDIAVLEDVMGCISKSMLPKDGQILTEGVQYLQGFDPDFAPGEQKGGTKYSFQLIRNTLKKYELENYLKNIIEMILFDAIIGNGDRHQENWGFISEHSHFSKRTIEFIRLLKKGIQRQDFWETGPRWLNWVIRKIYMKSTSPQLRDEVHHMNLTWNKNIRFAPIYDNGSSLGRELTEAAISVQLNNNGKFIQYVNNGLSEIHWNGEKISHFDLVANIKEEYPKFLKSKQQLLARFSEKAFQRILEKIDENVPNRFDHFKLSNVRKQYILKLVSSRVNRLESIINE